MAERIIPVHDARTSGLSLARGLAPVAWDGASLRDRLGRPLRDLRISVTDRCNFRCSYCMPKEVFDKNHSFLPQSDLLRFEEITRIAKIFMALGVTKLRLTGGEPLLRRGLEDLISMLASLRLADGNSLDLTLTTNASALARKAVSLRQAGLKRITISLDALDDAKFRQMNDVDFPVADVLLGIDAARAAGLGPIKVNMVVKRGTNDDQIVPMASYFREHYPDVALRFIEYMDVGATNGWNMQEVLPSAEVIQRIHAVYPLRALEPTAAGETAQRWAYEDGRGEVGVISSVTQAFCGDCNRARLSTEGKVYLCLFAHHGYDLRSLVRDGASDDDIKNVLGHMWHQRQDRYSQSRGLGIPHSADGSKRVEMSYIGG